jgi:hypothetical protein
MMLASGPAPSFSAERRPRQNEGGKRRRTRSADDPGNLPGAIRLFAWSLEPFSGGHEACAFCEVAN